MLRFTHTLFCQILLLQSILFRPILALLRLVLCLRFPYPNLF